jgi:hypothetical protein
MPTFRYQQLSTPGPRSLVWRGYRLVDWLGGLETYGLDGSKTRGRINWAYRFDTVVQSSDGRYTVLYERLGTKGLILRGETIVREIDRSFYCADSCDSTAPSGLVQFSAPRAVPASDCRRPC